MLRLADIFALDIPPRAVLRCPRCAATYSADPRDYWYARDDPRAEREHLRCNACSTRGPGVALQLVTVSEQIEVHAR